MVLKTGGISSVEGKQVVSQVEDPCRPTSRHQEGTGHPWKIGVVQFRAEWVHDSNHVLCLGCAGSVCMVPARPWDWTHAQRDCLMSVCSGFTEIGRSRYWISGFSWKFLGPAQDSEFLWMELRNVHFTKIQGRFWGIFTLKRYCLAWWGGLWSFFDQGSNRLRALLQTFGALGPPRAGRIEGERNWRLRNRIGTDFNSPDRSH